MSTTKKVTKTSNDDEKKFTCYFMDFKSKKKMVQKKVFTKSTFKAFDKKIFKGEYGDCFSLNVVRGVDTDNLVFYFEESNKKSRFNKSAVWIAKHLPRCTPTGSFIITRKNFLSNVDGDDVDVGLSLKEIGKLLKSYSKRKHTDDFNPRTETTITQLRECKTEFSGYLNRQRQYHNYITRPFHANRKSLFCVSNGLMQKCFPGRIRNNPFSVSQVEYSTIYSSFLLRAIANAAGKILLHPESKKEIDAQIPDFKFGFVEVSDVYVSAFMPNHFKTRFTFKDKNEKIPTVENYVVHLRYENRQMSGEWACTMCLGKED